SLSLSRLTPYDPPSPAEISTLSLHDALPICHRCDSASAVRSREGQQRMADRRDHQGILRARLHGSQEPHRRSAAAELGVFLDDRSEEHTSELQSRFDLVCRLLLEKKKKRRYK